MTTTYETCPLCEGEGQLEIVDWINHRNEKVRRIIFEEAERGQVQVPDMLSPKRDDPTCRARDRAMRRMREELGMPLTAIGAVFRRNHTSVISAIKRAKGA